MISDEMRRQAILREMVRRILQWLGPKAERWYWAGLFDLVRDSQGVWSLEWREPIKSLAMQRRTSRNGRTFLG